MDSNKNNKSHAAPARGFVALFAVMLAIWLAAMASPAEAAPFAYVANSNDNTVSVIDTATNMVVATIALKLEPVFDSPARVAIAPDGKHAYVTSDVFDVCHFPCQFFGVVSVIETASNTVVATIPVGTGPSGVAITPDGTHVYVANSDSSTVSVIDTASNIIAATIPLPVGDGPGAVAITPDGKHAYVTNYNSNTVLSIDTASNTVAGTPIPVGTGPAGVVITPDGKHAYVTNFNSNTVLSIDTASNTVVATITFPVGTNPGAVAVTPDGKHVYVVNSVNVIPYVDNVSVIDTATNSVAATITFPVGTSPGAVAVAPDGKHAYVTNSVSGLPFGTVSVIDTASNTIVGAQIPVGNGPDGVGIIPDVPFLAFGANLVIAFGGAPNQDAFALQTSFTLSSTAPSISPLTQPVTLQSGTFAVTIPPGSFQKTKQGYFIFVGVINGAELEALIAPTGTLRYAFQAKAVHASLTGTTNPVTVRLSIGADSGTTPITALIFH